MNAIKKTDEKIFCCNFFLLHHKNNIQEYVINKNYLPEKNCMTGYKLSCTLCISLCTIIISCSSLIPEKESWEGFHNTTLRIFVQYNYIDDVDGRINTATNEQLLDTGRIRAEIILLSYVRIHVSGVERAAACQHHIAGILAGGAIRQKICRDDNCAAYIDFDVKDFLMAAE